MALGVYTSLTGWEIMSSRGTGSIHITHRVGHGEQSRYWEYTHHSLGHSAIGVMALAEH